MSMLRGAKRLGILYLFAPVVGAVSANADAVSDFYGNKPVTIYVGHGAGGGFDLYARLVAAHYGEHIPGRPNVIVKNMPGGGARKAAAFLANASPQDGSALGMFAHSLTLETVLRPEAKFRMEKFAWIGRVTAATQLAYVWHTAPAKSVQDAIGKEITIASSSPTSTASMIPLVLNRIVGTKFRPILGYRGSAAMALATERGETDAAGAISLEALQSRHADWLRDKKINFLYTVGVRRLKEFPDVPALPEFAKTADDSTILAAIGATTEIGRALVGEPGIPKDRARVLRRAFMDMVRDPEFLADANKRKMPVDPLDGEALQKIVAEIASIPKPLVESLKEVIQKK